MDADGGRWLIVDWEQALRWHPDRQPADMKDVALVEFKALAEAYEALSDGELPFTVPRRSR